MNNPVIFIDPDGRSVDWFENKITGDVYYNSEYKKGDESKIKGEGWEHMGENGMFSDGTPLTSDVAIITGNADIASSVSLEQEGGTLKGEASFTGDNAKAFMSKQGYDLVPTQQTIYESEMTNYYPAMPEKGLKITTGEEIRITENVGYMRSGNIEIGKTYIEEISSKYDVISLSKVSRCKIRYSDNAWVKISTSIINLSKQLSGAHDYRMKKIYNNWKLYPGNNTLINKYRNTYGTK